MVNTRLTKNRFYTSIIEHCRIYLILYNYCMFQDSTVQYTVYILLDYILHFAVYKRCRKSFALNRLHMKTRVLIQSLVSSKWRFELFACKAFCAMSIYNKQHFIYFMHFTTSSTTVVAGYCYAKYCTVTHFLCTVSLLIPLFPRKPIIHRIPLHF